MPLPLYGPAAGLLLHAVGAGAVFAAAYALARLRFAPKEAARGTDAAPLD